MANPDVTRKILDEIDRNPAISQKRLSEEVGISVGMINWHMKRCVSMGLVKLKQAPVRRYLYYLTPDGFSEKARLTASFLQSSLDIFREGRQHYHSLFSQCEQRGWHHIILFGDTELTELALLVAGRFPKLHVAGIVDNSASRKEHYGIPLAKSLQDMPDPVRAQDIQAVVMCHYPASVEGPIEDNIALAGLCLDSPHYLVPEFLQ